MTTDETRPAETDVREDLARVGAFLRKALRFWMVPVVALALGAVASAVFLYVKKPTYRSETVILYSEGIRQSDGDEPRDASRSVTTRLKEILNSRSELRRVVDDFHLYPGIVRERGPVDAVDELRHHVEFKAPGGDTFSIAFEGASPEEAQRVTTRLSELVIDQDASLRKKQAVVTRDFLELEKMGTESRLRDSEQALASFMAAHPRFALDATPLSNGAAIRATMGGPEAGALAPGAPFYPRPKIAALPAAPGRPEGSASAAPASHEAIEEQARSAAALAEAQARFTDLSARFTPQYPDVRNAQAEVDRAKARVAAAAVAAGRPPMVDTRRAGNSAPAEVAQVTIAPSPRPVSRGPSTPVVVPARNPEDEHNVVALETDWVKLTRGVTEARQHQDHVESALFKADIAASSEVGGHGVQVSVIDPAFLPERPVPPGRSLIVAVILAASFVLGLIGAAIGAAFDDRIFDQHELTRLAPVLVAVPARLGRFRG